jgi:hypothetical protein
MKAKFVRHSDLQDRDVYVLSVRNMADLREPPVLPSAHYAVFLACDTAGMRAQTIGRFVRKFIDSGAVYFCCYGDDCSRVHDIIDEEDVWMAQSSGEEAIVMTTWHDKDTLENAMEFFLRWTVPDEKFVSSCRINLAVSVGNEAYTARILDCLNVDRLAIGENRENQPERPTA